MIKSNQSFEKKGKFTFYRNDYSLKTCNDLHTYTMNVEAKIDKRIIIIKMTSGWKWAHLQNSKQ